VTTLVAISSRRWNCFEPYSIDRMKGAYAVALSCTEIPLLVSGDDSQLPILDSTRILARAALREAGS
jgi:aspartate racemase